MFILGPCSCGRCAPEDPECLLYVEHLCKVDGEPDLLYKENECANCGALKHICGETCNYCEPRVKN